MTTQLLGRILIGCSAVTWGSVIGVACTESWWPFAVGCGVSTAIAAVSVVWWAGQLPAGDD